MSSLTNINNNSSVVNVGRTTPVTPGQKPSSKSIPVVVASDQSPIPVVEQNKIQSEVALSLLGIPRSEVALGIFADVNTYDVNPNEWSATPSTYTSGIENGVRYGHGVKHIQEEAGALIEAPRNETALLSSKRFFRYQPGRVSAATFGIKSTVSGVAFSQNPVIRKYGIFDKYDGYYWENRQNGVDDNFTVVRRTNSLYRTPSSIFGTQGSQLKGPASTPSNVLTSTQLDDYRVVGKAPNVAKPSSTRLLKDRKILSDNRNALIDAAWTQAMTNPTFSTYYNTTLNSEYVRLTFKNKCARDADYWMDMYLMDIEFNCDAHTAFNTRNYETSLAYKNGIATYEIILYNALKTVINSTPSYHTGLTTTTKNELISLVDKTITFFTAVDASNGSSNNDGAVFTSPTVYPSLKSRIETMFDVRRQYWAYYTNEYKSNGDPVIYDPMPTGYLAKFGATTNAGSWNANNAFPPTPTVSGSYYTVTSVPNGIAKDIGGGVIELFKNGDVLLYISGEKWIKIPFDIIKDKCIRDMLYVIDGYRDDLIGGGNAATKYNASMYYSENAATNNYMTVYTQKNAEQLPDEKDRHIHLRDKIKEDLQDTYFVGTVNTAINSKFYTVGDATSLANIIVNNFSIQDTNVTEYGDRGVAGNLVILRDGLVMVHAAVYDPALLKAKDKIVAVTTPTSSFKLSSGVVTFDQHVLYTGPTLSIGATAKVESGKLYQIARVIGPKGNEFTIKNGSGVEITFDKNLSFTQITFQIVNPFIFPKAYDPTVYRTGVTPNYTDATDPFPSGMMFPYMYTSNGSLPKEDPETYSVGYIDTAIQTDINYQELASQIDSVNFTQEYINWIKNNVDPEYYGVYEYRVPRSRYSNDQLNGVQITDEPNTGNKLVYSDIAIGDNGKAYPGQTVMQGSDNVEAKISSVYDYDFTKVTMLKIEFSWYGAVGALFLAYVPVGNGEARWVRVHHLRASNQLKIASLGNATLPITYNVYGGGDDNTKGDGEPSQNLGYERSSHYIVKYGASYYIDGGDRGTVRLYSNDNSEMEDVYGRIYDVSNGTYDASDTLFGVTGIPSINTNVSALNDLPDNVFFMGAKVKTNNRIDQNIKVIWTTSSKIYLSSPPVGSSIKLVTDRANTVYGLETKENIISTQNRKIRNRVQVYPTQLSTVNLGSVPVRVRLKKTPIFQSTFAVNGSFALTSKYEITSDKNPLPTSSSSYLEDGGYTYGWFRGLLDETENITVFGKLYRIGTDYYFDMIDTYIGKVELVAQSPQSFLRELRFNSLGDELTTSDVKILTEKEGLSSVKIAITNQVPVPNTGTNIATLYIQPGTEQLDMATYFDYNKEYLSYPLTNVADTLYFAVDAEGEINITSPTTLATVGIGITWEEQ